MIPAHSATDDTITNARVRRADQRGSAGGAGRVVEIGTWDAVTEGSSGAYGSVDRSTTSQSVSEPCLFKVQAANATHFKMVTIFSMPREIRRLSRIGCHQGRSGPLLLSLKVGPDADLSLESRRLNDECPDVR